MGKVGTFTHLNKTFTHIRVAHDKKKFITMVESGFEWGKNTTQN